MAYSNMYQKTIYHRGLGKQRIVKGYSPVEVDYKAAEQMQRWDEQWKRKQEQERKARDKAEKARYLEESKDEATRRSNEAAEANEALVLLLNNYLMDDISPVDFEKMKKPEVFSEAEPSKPVLWELPPEPDRNSALYNTSKGILGKIIKPIQDKADQEGQARYDEDHLTWEKECDRLNGLNENKNKNYDEECIKWEERKKAYLEEAREYNIPIEKFREDYEKNEKGAIEEYFSLILDSISFGNLDYDREIFIEYRDEEKLMVVDYQMPTVEDLPNLKSVSYVKAKDEYKETFYSDAQMKKLYESVMYQTLLAVVHTIFDLTKDRGTVDAIAFNGFVKTIDRSTGNNVSPYILSISITRESFVMLNLKEIDAREWFKSAKGVSAASLANVTPIRPIVEISREDKRFIDGYEVVDMVDDSVNLAAMDWQDFENLIRELFEEEFSTEGGEVKITQASRDGGVDAVAFDPDPIRGGKIVIQAKRYTNVVGVSAVRDLYGTVMNEGAMKGILVTTSNYGNDAYDFAKDKPLTLLNGANLLYLMEKHGHKAKIDLKEAKELLTN